jgi:putative endonuclease
MFSGLVTQKIVCALDWLAARTLPRTTEDVPVHQQTGRRGEEDAYFYLRRQGYVVIARNYRSPQFHGELDLVAWNKDVLCFIEVKTRTTHDVKPAQASVDYAKQKDLALVAREFLTHIPHSCQCRFDIIAIYYDGGHEPTFELFQNAFPMSYNH